MLSLLCYLSAKRLSDLIDTLHEDGVGLVHLGVRSHGHVVDVNIGKGFPDLLVQNYFGKTDWCSSLT